MAKQSLSQQQRLQQKLTPQQMQAIKLLEVPTIELEKKLKEEIEKNPLLEIENHDNNNDTDIDKDIEIQTQNDTELQEFDHPDNNTTEEPKPTLDEAMELQNNLDEYPEYKLYKNNYTKEDYQIQIASRTSFREELENQLNLSYNLTDKQKIIAQYIIGNLDNNGYLTKEYPFIRRNIIEKAGIIATEQEIDEVLKTIQKLDPAGIGARNLQECLLLQLKRKKPISEEEKKYITLATKIIENYIEELGSKHFEKIIKKLNITEDELKKALDLIKTLNPKPGLSINENVTQNYNQIVPDFILTIDEDTNEIEISLHQKNSPSVRISNKYDNEKLDRKTASYIKEHKEKAKWFIDSLEQRKNTMLKVMKAIVDHQKEFFLTQDEKNIKPLILKDIAEKTNLDVSTISRTIKDKYVETPMGIYPLKFFFSERSTTTTGEEVSTREIKEIIKEIVENEDKRHPYSDEKIAQILKNKGYKVARRTVAKYREQMNIPDSRLRKEI